MPWWADHGIFAICVGAPNIGPRYLDLVPTHSCGSTFLIVFPTVDPSLLPTSVLASMIRFSILFWCTTINASTSTGPCSLYEQFMMMFWNLRNFAPTRGFVKKSPNLVGWTIFDGYVFAFRHVRHKKVLDVHMSCLSSTWPASVVLKQDWTLVISMNHAWLERIALRF